MIVDDDENIRKILTLIFEKQGYKIDSVGTGEEALSIIKERIYNIVLLDVKLPDIEGIDLIPVIKELQPRLSIIMVTAYTTNEIVIRALNLGATAYITKPFNMEEVLIKVQEIIEKQRLELALEDSEKKYRNLVDTLIEGLWVIDQEAYTTFVTPRMAEMLGYSVEEMLGKPLFEFMDQQGERIAEQNLERRKSGIKENHHFEFLKKDGTRIYTSMNTSPMFDKDNNYTGALATVTDVTEQKKNQDAVQAERELAQKYLDIAGVMMVALDSNGCVTLINKKGCEILDFQEDEVLGKSWFDCFIPERFREEVKGIYNQLMNMKRENVEKYENLILTKQGNERLISWHNSVLQDSSGNITGTLSSGEDITESARAKKILQKTAAILIQAQKLAVLGHWEWNIETNELVWSEEIFHIFGVNPTNFAASFDAFLDFIHPDDREFVNNSIDDTLKLDKAYNIEHRIIRSSGEILFVNEVGEVIRDASGHPTYMIGTVQDITKRKKIELALSDSKDTLESKVEMRTMELLNEKKRIETIIETLPAGILVIDNDGHFYMSNKVFKDLYLQIYDTELPQSIKEIIILGNPFGDTISHFVYSDKNKTITIEPLEGQHLEMTSSSLIDSSNTPIGVIISVRDVSPFIEVDRLRQQFVSMVSHELRTPITAIDLSLKNLQTYKDRLSEEQKDKLITMVADSSSILNQMVEDLLIVSRIEAGELKLQFKPISVKKLIENTLYQIEPKCKVKEIEVTVDMKPKIELFGDYKRLSQVFRILLDNAIKYSPENSVVSISVTENYKGIESPEEIEGTLIEITDQGIGIEIREQSKLFQRFFRGSNTRGSIGTGLGLSIAKEFITLHGGKIYVKSQIGKGSSFYIFFPNILYNLNEKDEKVSSSSKNELLNTLQG